MASRQPRLRLRHGAVLLLLALLMGSPIQATPAGEVDFFTKPANLTPAVDPFSTRDVSLPPYGSCGPGQCIGGSFCDNCLCYDPNHVISRAFCECRLANPACGLGECINGSYCDGPHCPDGVCWAPDQPISQVMCGDATLGPDCKVKKDCGEGRCIGGSFCDDCVCYEPDAPISQLACACDLIDPLCGEGHCVGGSYCEGPNCPAPVCYIPTHPASLVMCLGGELKNDCTEVCFPVR